MKKLKKILAPVLACGALAAATPALAMLVSCNNGDNIDKTIAGYTIDLNTNHILGLNKQGQQFALTDKQIDSLAGGYLVTLGDNSYVYVDKDGKGSDGGTWPKTIAEWMERAQTTHAVYYEIWLCGGEYNLDAPQGTAFIKFDIKGVLDNHDKLTSSVNILPGHEPHGTEKVTTKVDLGNFWQLNFTSVNIIGSQNEKQGFGWHVEGADEITFTYCNFEGLAVFSTPSLDIYGCTIDSDCIEWNPPADTGRTYSTTQYGLIVEDVDFAVFSYCDFISDGKAAKLYPSTEANEPTYVFNTCNFNIGPKGIPPEDRQTGENHNDQDKTALDLNTQNLGTNEKIHIYWYEIKGDILSEGAPRDWENHRGAIGGDPNPAIYNPEKVDFHEGELPK